MSKANFVGVLRSYYKEGWAEVDQLINNMSVFAESVGQNPVSRVLLDEIVATNNKGRFEYSKDGWKIRATHGHSIGVSLGLNPTVPPEFLYHGTIKGNLSSIRNDGIKKMSRDFVHLSSSESEVANVAKRKANENEVYVLKIEALKMNNDGYDFYCSKSNIWLTEEVPSEYIVDYIKYKKGGVLVSIR